MNSEIEARIAALEARVDHAEAELEAARVVIGNIMAAIQKSEDVYRTLTGTAVLHEAALKRLGITFEKRETPQASGTVQ